ncbi:hypothetical protein Sste5346_008882 [Sporothrix stenoceras]|uniref:Uncharacterized protein n=1 Tax=Sporothrix stenoceras TaxID=5173 RepID=A0ABR3YQ37_9PEZI
MSRHDNPDRGDNLNALFALDGACLRDKTLAIKLNNLSVHDISFLRNHHQGANRFLIDLKTQEALHARKIATRDGLMRGNILKWLQSKDHSNGEFKAYKKWRQASLAFIHEQMVEICKLRYRIQASTEILARPNGLGPSCFRKQTVTDEQYRDMVAKIHKSGIRRGGMHFCAAMGGWNDDITNLVAHRFLDFDFPMGECCAGILFDGREEGDLADPTTWVRNAVLVSSAIRNLHNSLAMSFVPKRKPIGCVPPADESSSDGSSPGGSDLEDSVSDSDESDSEESGSDSDSDDDTLVEGGQGSNGKKNSSQKNGDNNKAYRDFTNKYTYHCFVLDDVKRCSSSLGKFHDRKMHFTSKYRPDPRFMQIRFIFDVLRRRRIDPPDMELHPDVDALLKETALDLWESVDTRAQFVLYHVVRCFEVMTDKEACQFWGLTLPPIINRPIYEVENVLTFAMALATQM